MPCSEVDRWELLKSLSYERSNLTIAAMQGKIYAIGGNDSTKSFADVAQYLINQIFTDVV